MENRRVYERRPLIVTTKVVSLEKKSPFKATFNTKDFSLGGVFIESPTCLKAGTKLNLEFSLPFSVSKLNLKGEVVYSINESLLSEEDKTKRNMSPGMGIKFLDINNNDAKAISDFLPDDEVGVFVSNYLTTGISTQNKLDFYEACKLLQKWESRRKSLN